MLCSKTQLIWLSPAKPKKGTDYMFADFKDFYVRHYPRLTSDFDILK